MEINQPGGSSELEVGTTLIIGGTSGLFLYDNHGVLGEMAGGGSQTPWTSNIDGGNYTLSNISGLSINMASYNPSYPATLYFDSSYDYGTDTSIMNINAQGGNVYPLLSKLVFNISNSGTLTPALDLTSTRAYFPVNVGIGTDNPTAVLDVASTSFPCALVNLSHKGAGDWAINLGNETVSNIYIGLSYGAAGTALDNFFWRANWNTSGVAANTFQNPGILNYGVGTDLTTVNIQGNSGQTGDLFHISSSGDSGNIFKVGMNGNVALGSGTLNIGNPGSYNMTIGNTIGGATIPPQVLIQSYAGSTPWLTGIQGGLVLTDGADPTFYQPAVLQFADKDQTVGIPFIGGVDYEGGFGSPTNSVTGNLFYSTYATNGTPASHYFGDPNGPTRVLINANFSSQPDDGVSSIQSWNGDIKNNDTSGSYGFVLWDTGLSRYVRITSVSGSLVVTPI